MADEPKFPKKQFNLTIFSYNIQKYIDDISKTFKSKAVVTPGSEILLPYIVKGGTDNTYSISNGTVFKLKRSCFIYSQHYAGKWDPYMGIKVFVSDNSSMSNACLLIDTNNTGNGTAHSNNMFLISAQNPVFIAIFRSNAAAHTTPTNSNPFGLDTMIVPTYGKSINATVGYGYGTVSEPSNSTSSTRLCKIYEYANSLPSLYS